MRQCWNSGGCQSWWEGERESDREREADRESVTFSCLKGIPVWMKHGVITTSEFGFSVTIWAPRERHGHGHRWVSDGRWFWTNSDRIHFRNRTRSLPRFDEDERHGTIKGFCFKRWSCFFDVSRKHEENESVCCLKLEVPFKNILTRRDTCNVTRWCFGRFHRCWIVVVFY